MNQERKWAEAQKTGSEIMMPKFKILVTSRPEIQIKIAFRTNSKGNVENSLPTPPQHAIIRLQGEDEIDAISDDIAKVVHAKIDELICQGFPVGVLNGIRSKILAGADRTFLWVSLILSLLEQKVEAGASRRELYQLLRNRDIYNIYSELLAACSDSQGAQKILQIMLAATRPMTVTEISIALAVKPEDETKRNGKTTFRHVGDDIISLCGHFIRIIREKVYFVHDTVREFFLKRSSPMIHEEWDMSSSSSEFCSTEPTSQTEIGRCRFQYSFTLDESQILLLRICTTYLYCLGRTSERRLLSTSGSGILLFLDYAAKSWMAHFHQTRRLISLDYEYYQNLCHPLFPGFERWTTQYWSPKIPPHSPGSIEQVQDFYISQFELCPHRNVDKDIDLDVPMCLATEEQNELDISPIYNHNGLDYSIGEEIEIKKTAQYPLSTNPGSLKIDYFPTRVNASGFVSLDLSGTEARKD